MARPFARVDLTLTARLHGTAGARRRAGAAELARPAFDYARLCVWPVSI